MQNPYNLIKNSIAQIQSKANKDCRDLKVDFFQVERWLIQNRAEQLSETEKLFNAINSDVYGKFAAGTLLEFEYKSWSSVLEKWRNNWIALLTHFWQQNKGSLRQQEKQT